LLLLNPFTIPSVDGWSRSSCGSRSAREKFAGENASPRDKSSDGKLLWHFNTGQIISASPMSYAVEGKQYVSIAAGSDVFSFALP
jgi:hypothetical protein